MRTPDESRVRASPDGRRAVRYGKPRIGAWIVAVWLWGIIINLFLIPGFYDIALRDFGLLVGALALARLATAFHAHPSRARTVN